MRHSVIATITLLMGATFFLPTASAQRHPDEKSGSDRFCESVVVKRWRRVGPTRRATEKCSDQGPTNMTLHKKMLRLRGNYFMSKYASSVFEGQKDQQELRFYVDALATTRLGGGRPWFPIFWVDSRRQAPVRAPLALYLYNHRNAAQLIAGAIATPKHVGLAFSGSEPTPWWALWYLGAKQHAPTIIDSLLAANERNRPVTRHAQFVLSVLDRWNLNPALKAKVESFCLNHVLRPGASHRGAALGCMRYLGRIRTNNKVAHKLIADSITGRATLGSLEAFRALSHIGVKSIKKQAKANLKSAERKFVKVIKRGRRVKQVTYVGYTAHHDAVPSAIYLAGLGDRKALKIIDSWLMTYDITGNLHQENAFLEVFQEAPFASPKAIKKLKPMLRKALKKALSKAKNSKIMERVALTASLSLLQLGDNIGLKTVLKAIGTVDRKRLYHIAGHMGAVPSNTYKAWGIGTGIGRLKVGKNGLSIGDAKKLVNALRRRFQTIPPKKADTRSYLLQAIADINAVILVAQQNL